MENQFPVTFLFIRPQSEAQTRAAGGGPGYPGPWGLVPLVWDTPEQGRATAHRSRGQTLMGLVTLKPGDLDRGYGTHVDPRVWPL